MSESSDSSESEDTTLPGPHNEDDELVFLDGKQRRKYIDEVKEPAERVRKKPRWSLSI